MITLTPQMKFFIAVQPVDFRCGIDGLSQICKYKYEQDPLSGAIFLFRNRKGTSMKALVYDGQGFWLFQKRLSRGRFKYWPKSEGIARSLSSQQVSILLYNGDPLKSNIQPDWKQVA